MCSELSVEAIQHSKIIVMYVHCDNITGNRSATVVVAYMIKYHDMLLDDRPCTDL
jgi:protein-tyrosine phosphatase